MNKFRVWDKKYNAYDDDMFIRSDGELYDKASKTYDTPNIEIEKEEQDRYIVEFFTGLTVNGVDVYEGDICKVHQFTMELGASLGVYEGEREFIAVVKFSESGVSFNDELYSDLNFEDIDEQIEMLGSIHTHKHLLEGE